MRLLHFFTKTLFKPALPPLEFMESGPLPADVIEGAGTLTIFMKDGYSFFRANKELLTRRFRAGRPTRIIIVHPDSPQMPAVANMDDGKAGAEWEKQWHDCLDAIAIMQGIRQEILSDTNGAVDIKETVQFVGHDQVPTWAGIVTDELVIRDLYRTMPYRGTLRRTIARRVNPDDKKAQRTAKKYFGEAWRANLNWAAAIYNESVAEMDYFLGPDAPVHNLWDYQLPVRTERPNVR